MPAVLRQLLLLSLFMFRPCPFGSTAPPGSFELEACVSVAQECPIGQIAPEDAVSSEQCSCYPGFGGK
jgi:hypothetical protein